MPIKLVLTIVVGLAVAIVITLGMMIANQEAPLEVATTDAAAMADRRAPAANNDPMDPVVAAEAVRRRQLHSELGAGRQELQGDEVGYVAPTVVTEIRSADGDDPVTKELFGDAFVVTEPAIRPETRREPAPEPEPAAQVEEAPEPAPEPEVEAEPVEMVQEEAPREEPEISADWMRYYRERQGRERPGTRRDFGIQSLEPALDMPMEGGALLPSAGEYLSDPATLARARARNAARDDVLEPVLLAGGLDDFLRDPIVVRRQLRLPTTDPYSAPRLEERSAARPPMVVTDQFGSTYTTGSGPNPFADAFQGPLVLARGGDLTYGVLLYGFDSTDVQGLPIYATIVDVLPNGRRGPLDGARIRGEVSYSRDDAAIVFDQATLASGLEIPISAVAISEQDGRTGVAGDVDRHRLSRYGSLFLSGLIEGYGEVAQIRLREGDRDGTTIVNTGDGDIRIEADDRDEPSDGEIVAGAVRPIGNRLSDAAASNFDRPFTITAPAGMGFSLVFLRTIVFNPDDVTGRAFNPRTERFEAVRLRNDVPEGGPAFQQGTEIPQAVQDAVRGQ